MPGAARHKADVGWHPANAIKLCVRVARFVLASGLIRPVPPDRRSSARLRQHRPRHINAERTTGQADVARSDRHDLLSERVDAHL
jgi:hypothetical protein